MFSVFARFHGRITATTSAPATGVPSRRTTTPCRSRSRSTASRSTGDGTAPESASPLVSEEAGFGRAGFVVAAATGPTAPASAPGARVGASVRRAVHVATRRKASRINAAAAAAILRMPRTLREDGHASITRRRAPG
jgi:hypothetical protein